MHKTRLRLISCVVTAAMLLSLLLLCAAAAGYTLGDSGYTKIGTLPNTNVATQGMTADENYIYTFKMPSGNNNNAIIYRTDIATGSTIALTNAADTSTTVLSGLGHGNDMCAVVHNGKTYLYLATLYHTGHAEFSTHSIWKLEVSGKTVRKVAYYDVYDGSSPLNFTGLTVHSQSDSSVRLLGHISSHIFYMDIGLNQSSGTVKVGYGCSINYKSATVPTGAPGYSSSYYDVQGMTYNNGLLYFVMTANSSNTPRNKNYILAYDISKLGTDTSKRNNLQAETIYLTSSHYDFFLEIESLCAVHGRMYFAANAGSGSNYYSAEDFVGYFNHYFHTNSEGVLLEFNSGSRETKWNWRHYIGSSGTAISPNPTAANGSLSGRLGVLSVDGQTSTDSFVRMTAGDVYHRLSAGDIVEIGMNYHCVAGAPPTASTVFITTNTIGYFTPERMFNCTHIFTEGKNTLQYSLASSSDAAVGEIISQLRIDLFDGGTSDFVAEYSIDYIYIGPAVNAPGNIEKYTGNGTLLYLDFVSASPKHDNSDWIGNNVSFNIDQGQGVFNGTVTGADPYFHLTENISYSPLSGDIVDVRIKHDITSGIYGGMEFFYTTSESPDFSGDKYLVHSATSYGPSYQTIRLSLPSSVVGKTITKIRIDPVSSAADVNLLGSFAIDYIYLGPPNKAPTSVCAVRFCDESGTLLQSQSVLSGNGAPYSGQMPTKSYNDTVHYDFDAWVDANGVAVDLSTIVSDITVYASFRALPHSFEQSIVKPATCAENGIILLSCACGYSKTETIDKTDHTPEQTAYKAPTCTQSGMSEGTYCAVCGEILAAQQVIPALGHTSVTRPAVAATCTQTGLTQGAYCSVCGETITAQLVTPATGHSVVIDDAVAATCTKAGLSEGKHCAVCNLVLLAQKEIAPTAHTYQKVVTAPTCTTMGYTTYTCTSCVHSYQADYVEMAGHSEVIDKAVAPTCTETGLSEGKHCSVCGKCLLVQEEISALGHTYDTGIVTSQPTCTSEGVITYTCHCGSAYTQMLGKTEHRIVFVEEVTATCETDGHYAHYACDICCTAFADSAGKYSLPDGYLTLPATGHSIVYREKLAPTCEESGWHTHYLCRLCGKAYADSSGVYPLPQSYVILSPTGHNYTYTDNGVGHTATCENCNLIVQQAHSYQNSQCICGAVESTEPQLDANLKFNMNIAIGAEMVVNYNFMASTVSKYEDFYLEVKKNVAGGDPIVTTFGISDGYTQMGVMNHPVTGEALLYNASYNGINAKEMGDTFETTLYAIDASGKVFKSETAVRSIKEFMMGKLNDAKSSDELKTMAVDMLRYGEAAQHHFSYDTENLVTNELTEEHLAYATKDLPVAENYQQVSGDGANVTTSIIVGSKVELSLSTIVRNLADSSAVKCVITDEEGKFLAELATGCLANAMFSAKYDNVGAREMRKMICATFYDADGNAISKTLSWSVESYVAQTRANAKAGETEINMVNTMLTYGDSVAAYLDASGL